LWDLGIRLRVRGMVWAFGLGFGLIAVFLRWLDGYDGG